MSKILVVGDSMIDRYWFGDVERISPEAPVVVVSVQKTEDREGGAANVANNITAMGEKAETLFSPIVDENQVLKIRVIGKSQQVVRIDFDYQQLPIDMKEYLEKLDDCSMVVFSDYGKGALQNIQELISIAKNEDKMVLVDPKGHEYWKYRGADVVKPNLAEMKELVGGWSDEEGLSKKAHKLMREMGVKAILLTRASEGLTIYTEVGQKTIPTHAVEVYDVSGAGDTAIAALAVGLHRGMDLEKAAYYANKAAGIVVGRFGTAVATHDEVFS